MVNRAVENSVQEQASLESRAEKLDRTGCISINGQNSFARQLQPCFLVSCCKRSVLAFQTKSEAA